MCLFLIHISDQIFRIIFKQESWISLLSNTRIDYKNTSSVKLSQTGSPNRKITLFRNWLTQNYCDMTYEVWNDTQCVSRISFFTLNVGFHCVILDTWFIQYAQLIKTVTSCYLRNICMEHFGVNYERTCTCTYTSKTIQFLKLSV